MGALWQGLALGFAAGVAPGPLMALVAAESARGGWRRGVAAAMAPPVTDAAILPLAVLLLHRLPDGALRGISLAGGIFVAHLAWETLRATGRPLEASRGGAEAREPGGGAAAGFRRGLATNLLNPHPWLFWFTVGAPLFLAALRSGAGAAALLLVGFFVPLVGSKVLLAVLVDRGVRVLGSRFHAWVLRLGAAALAVMAVLLLRAAFGAG